MLFSEEKISKLHLTIKNEMSEYRFSHTAGVVASAEELGKLYMQESIDELCVAALLHDITKELTVEEHIALMKKHGLTVTDSDIASPQLFHAKTAELTVRDRYAEFATDRICQALRYHTTGSEDMTLFDAIIYIADYIEVGRTVEFCVSLRNYFWSAEPSKMNTEERETHLWRTVLLSLDMTIENIKNKGGAVDGATLRAREAVAKRLS